MITFTETFYKFILRIQDVTGVIYNNSTTWIKVMLISPILILIVPFSQKKVIVNYNGHSFIKYNNFIVIIIYI